ncbi:DNA helicase UvrD [Salmonella enterica subsp. enterica serovar Panama]|uniref:DNA 3'-5' helicase II n=1 Tax=Salmonella enterica subsp. enterica serovar Panama TaxID=29472 RepID=A0A619AG84_SALET|nr:DNA helicase UvrD [Salmonella enterica subsp. enterica serovar Panama]EGU5383944.1 AAA family ATPase [Salmonella enterica]ECX3497495.1 AAA family ATPase [Salmonella enterica subsp. enterica serovar Panama]ECX6035097.1 AAA family ATPase [Salmonella enterica subsp. enterica serovar Panama]EGX1719422.1 AAA family ATPase [Salmonella enterica subsp. enterica serovar Panama]
MAKLMTSLAQSSQRMTWGERRVAQRLETHLGDDCLIWYDIPVGRQYQHPDFVIIDPSSGLIFLEVKDWRRSTFCHADPLTVILETGQGEKREKNPLVQVREYACATAEMLSREPLLQQTGIYQGKLNVAWAYGVVFTNITRQQLNALSVDGTAEAVFPEALTICQDEMTESVSPQAFRNKIAGLFTTRFRPAISPSTRDIIRRHLFPEIVIPAKKSDSNLLKVMDIQQELLARNIGEGHRVIHGVAGSGKTLILLYRCQYLAENSERPVLVLCFNITLANYIRESIADRGLSQKVHVYHFHDWCGVAARKFRLTVSREGPWFDNSFAALEGAVDTGVITDIGYDAVLIDEGHDFDRRWLALIARLFDNSKRSLLLMYDDAQSLYRRERALNFSLASVGIQAQGRTSVLRVNYRNPECILSFAYAFSRDYFEKHRNQEVPLVLPEACGDKGKAPDIMQCRSAEEEAFHVADWLGQKYAHTGRWGDMAVLCPTRFSAQRLTEVMEERGIPFVISFTSADKKHYSHKDNVVHLLTFQSSKGLEFPFVAVINASFVHQGADDEGEAIPALYVAFTRSTRELLVTFYRENSISRHLAEFAEMDLQTLQNGGLP